jgi:signal transduction histidine kinase
MISLKNRLALTYALFVGFILAVLTLVINLFTGLVFTALIKDNIAETSGEIVRVMGELYNPLMGGFDALAIETVGMHFVHEGYIVTVKDERGAAVWDARTCDMRQCSEVIDGITGLMESGFGISGGMQKQLFSIGYAGRTVGNVSIETYGPFFFSGPESKFISSINRLLPACGLAFILLSMVISLLLSRTIARPILKAGEAARQIAALHTGKGGGGDVKIRVGEKYKTRELEELSRSINELAEELEEGERRQKQLTSDIAHELRTPLTCLQGNIEAMIDGVWKPDRERLESCHEEVLRLNRLVEDLNTLKGFEWETVTLNRTGFDLSELLRLVVEQFSPAAGEKGVAITLKLPAPEGPEDKGPSFGINADYDSLNQVFINLLSNAVKYTDSGSVTVSIERKERKKGGQNLDVVIADTGIGIQAEDLPRVFERFYRSDKSRNRDSGGTGIGLSIAAAIAAAHGGTISA